MIDTTSTADSLVSLIDCITELFHKAGKIDAQNTSYTETTLPHSSTAVSLLCVNELFEKSADALAKEAYYFMPGDHSAKDLGRQSFKQLQQQWATEYDKSGKGYGGFPDTRKKNALDSFLRCTLRCACGVCRQGKAVELRCDACDFGDDQMVSDFVSRGKMAC